MAKPVQRKRGKNKRNMACFNCEHCILIGEGDHICDERIGTVVLEEYGPTDEYMWCDGKLFEER